MVRAIATTRGSASPSAAAVLIIAGRFYSGFLARHVGEDPTRRTPAIAYADGPGILTIEWDLSEDDIN